MKEKLKQLIEQAEKLINSSSDSPEFIAWRTDVLRFLLKRYGDKSIEVTSFKDIVFHGVVGYSSDWSKRADGNRTFHDGLETAMLYLKNYLDDDDIQTEQTQKQIRVNNENVFIVHGRDEGAKAQVASLIQKMKLKPIILHEQANEGKTIIEKFEKHTDVKAAVILFTGDDVGRYKDDAKDEKRPRQNVIFEAGYFMGKLGRKNTIILAEEGLNIQSDLQGYIYIPLDEHRRWHFDLAIELKTIGFNIDMNNVV